MIPNCILVIENDDDRAFMEELYLQYRNLMCSQISRIVKNEWNAEDVMQSVVVKLIDKISLLKSRNRNQRINYIITTCKNTALNYARDHERPGDSPYEDYLNTLSAADSDTDGQAMELRLVKEEERQRLARAWPKLDQRSRQLLEGYYILEKSMPELGQELGIQPKSVRMALTRARKNAYALLLKELEPKK